MPLSTRPTVDENISASTPLGAKTPQAAKVPPCSAIAASPFPRCCSLLPPLLLSLTAAVAEPGVPQAQKLRRYIKIGRKAALGWCAETLAKPSSKLQGCVLCSPRRRPSCSRRRAPVASRCRRPRAAAPPAPRRTSAPSRDPARVRSQWHNRNLGYLRGRESMLKQECTGIGASSLRLHARRCSCAVVQWSSTPSRGPHKKCQ